MNTSIERIYYRIMRNAKDFVYEVKSIPRRIKYRFQRMYRGWSDRDASDIDVWFLSVMPEMLKYQREHFLSIPGDFDPETGADDWKEILSLMEHYFRCAGTHECCSNGKDRDRYKDMAFDLFREWFFCLNVL